MERRKRCEKLMEYPFLTNVLTDDDKQDSLGALFEPDDPIQGFIKSLETYENRAFTSHDEASLQLRHLLGWKAAPLYSRLPPALMQVQELKPSGPPTKGSHESCFTLFAGYCLIDRWAEYSQVEKVTPGRVVPKRLDTALLEKVKMPHWDDLMNLPELLRRTREHAENTAVTTSPVRASDNESLVTHHLREMAHRHVQGQLDDVFNNLRMAALYLAYVLKRTGSSTSLPDLPDKSEILASWVETLPQLTQEEEYRIKEFLKTKPTQMRLALQLALTISPLYLLVAFALRRSQALGRENVLKVCMALGNEKPPALRKLETRLLMSLIEITLQCKDPKVALQELVKTDEWSYMEQLPLSDPAATFFRPVDLSPRIDGAEHTNDRQISVVAEDGNERNIALEDDTRGDLDLQSNTEPAPQNDTEPATNSTGQESVDSEQVSTSNVDETQTKTDKEKKKGTGHEKGEKQSGDQPTRKSKRIEAVEEIMGRKTYTDAAPMKNPSKKPRKHITPAIVEEEDIKPEISMTSRTKYWTPIDKDPFAEDTVTLDTDEKSKKFTTKEDITVYKPDGTPYRFKPRVHTEKILTAITDIIKAAEKTYDNGKPIHLHNPKEAGYLVIGYSDFMNLPDQTVQQIFRTDDFVLTECPKSLLSFKQALRKLGSLASVVDIQDQSIDVEEDKNGCIRKGSIGQILAAAEDEDGKILNALNFPMPLKGIERTSYSSDAHALYETINDRGWKQAVPPPIQDVVWSGASTKYAYHGWHIDSNGFATNAGTGHGAKLWMKGKPKSEKYRPFASINMFLNDEYDPDHGNDNLWDVEPIFLEEGTRVIIRPNTPHTVIALEHTVIDGLFFYAMSTMQDTCFGMMHTLVMEKFITNANHPASMLILRQMIIFVHGALVKGTIEKTDDAWAHVPDPLYLDSFFDLLTLCNIGILQNVLDSDTYSHSSKKPHNELTDEEKQALWKYDCNAVTLFNRQAAAYARALALDIFDWLDANYNVVFSDKACKPSSVAKMYIASQCAALLTYKRRAEEQGYEGATNCTAKMIRRQIEGIFPVKQDEMRLAIISSIEHEQDMLCFPEIFGDNDAKTSDIRLFRKDQTDRESLNLNAIGLTALDIAHYQHIGEDIDEELGFLEKTGTLVKMDKHWKDNDNKTDDKDVAESVTEGEEKDKENEEADAEGEDDTEATEEDAQKDEEANPSTDSSSSESDTNSNPGTNSDSDESESESEGGYETRAKRARSSESEEGGANRKRVKS